MVQIAVGLLSSSSYSLAAVTTITDAAVAAESQVGPIYLRETDKPISGTITYRIAPDETPKTAHFSMADDVFSRNHTWIVYACFMEETMKLTLKTVVLPWEWNSYHQDFKEATVNVHPVTEFINGGPEN